MQAERRRPNDTDFWPCRPVRVIALGNSFRIPNLRQRAGKGQVEQAIVHDRIGRKIEGPARASSVADADQQHRLGGLMAIAPAVGPFYFEEWLVIGSQRPQSRPQIDGEAAQPLDLPAFDSHLRLKSHAQIVIEVTPQSVASVIRLDQPQIDGPRVARPNRMYGVIQVSGGPGDVGKVVAAARRQNRQSLHPLVFRRGFCQAVDDFMHGPVPAGGGYDRVAVQPGAGCQ